MFFKYIILCSSILYNGMRNHCSYFQGLFGYYEFMGAIILIEMIEWAIIVVDVYRVWLEGNPVWLIWIYGDNNFDKWLNG